MHFRACAEHTSGNDVTYGHVTSCYFIPVRTASCDVTSSNTCVMARSPLLPLKYALSYPDILLWYLDLGGHPINNPCKIYQGRQSSCPLWSSVKGIARVFNWLKCLGGIMHLKSTAGYQISILIFENKLWSGVSINIPWKIYQGRQSSFPPLAKLKVLPGSLTDLSA